MTTGRHLRKILFGVAATACLVLGGSIAQAETAYPTRPIRLIVPYPAGGSVDFVGRIIGHQINEKLGQPVVVENRAGANGFIGSAAAAKSDPDGYTLLLGSVGPLAINPSLYKEVPFNAQTDFAPVALVAQVPLVLALSPNLKINSIQELLAKAKASPGELTFGSAGNGSTQHLGMEKLKSLTGTDIRHIPYKGEAPAVVDLLAGRIDMMMALLPGVSSHVIGGNLRPIGVSTLERVPVLPDVRTIDEEGVKGFKVVSWMGVLAPANTPKPIIDKLNEALASIPNDPAVKEKFEKAGVIAVYGKPDELKALLKDDTDAWANIIKEAKVTMD